MGGKVNEHAVFSPEAVDLPLGPCHTSSPMNSLALTVLALCALAITVALVAVLISFKRLIERGEAVLALVEREVRPTASQLGALTEELRGVSHQVTLELARIGLVTRRLDDITRTVAKVVGVVGGITTVSRLSGVAMGLQRGLGVFISRLKSRQA
jgi:uncharacterized protein YoxC